MFNYRLVILVLGALLIVESFFLGVSTIVSYCYGEDDFISLLIGFCICLLAGSYSVISNRKVDNTFKKRETFIIVTFGWVALSLFGALPFWFSGYFSSYSDAFFETISGFTTTGASVLNNIEELPHGLLLWRSFTQWIGGMGIIVLSIVLIPFMKTGGVPLFSAEAPGFVTEKLHPRIKQTAKRLWILYALLTVLETCLLVFFDMPIFDAICHSLTTMSSGGYSTKQDSLAAFPSPSIQYVVIIFMFLAGANFTLNYFFFTGQFKKIIKNSELKLYLLIVVLVSCIIAVSLYFFQHYSIEKSVRDALFQVVSIITTTGFITEDFLGWAPNWIVLFIVLLMFTGACSSSTSGGLKLSRLYVLFRSCMNEFKRMIHPNAVVVVRLNKTSLPTRVVLAVSTFFSLYILVIITATLLMTFVGVDLGTSFGSVLTSISNVGPGLGSTGPSGNFHNIPLAGKWILSFVMLVGRLELFTVLILFTRVFWRK